MNIQSSKQLKGIYAITDPELMGKDLLSMTQQAISGGINILQYRNKLAKPDQQMQEATILAQLCKEHAVTFIVNDNVELALQVDADGVHLGQTDTSITLARNQLGENKVIGVSCNNKIELALKAQQHGADYVAFGRFYNSLTKPGAPQAELSLLVEARQKLTVPIVAIGGISHESAQLLLKQGADMLAVIHGIFGQPDIQKASRQFVEIFNTSDTP